MEAVESGLDLKRDKSGTQQENGGGDPRRGQLVVGRVRQALVLGRGLDRCEL
jgi:hypothetical protein